MTEPLSRRDFLKIAAATVAGVAGASVGRKAIVDWIGKEQLSENSIKLSALRTEKIQGEDSIGQSLRVLREIEKSLKSEHLDLVITPEFSFETRWGREKDYEGMPLILKQVEEKRFVVDEINSHGAPKIIIENATSLAKEHKSNLLLATFFDPQGPEKTSAVFINSQGLITGLKRKFQPPLGAFEIDCGKTTLKVLPVICGEAWGGQNVPPSYKDTWVGEGAPFDILTHSLAQADVDFNGLAKLVYGKSSIDESKLYGQDEKWLEGAFNDYYCGYLPFLKPNAPIIIADWGIAAAFDKSLGAVREYKDERNYVVAKTPLYQPPQK